MYPKTINELPNIKYALLQSGFHITDVSMETVCEYYIKKLTNLFE